MQRRHIIRTVLAVALCAAGGVLASGTAVAAPVPAAVADQPGFTFGAVGDNGADGPGDPGDSSSRTLNLIGAKAPAFVQSLGDLAYVTSPAASVNNGADWCTWTAAQIAKTSNGATIPYLVSAGNHEAQDAKPGFTIEDYTAAPSCADPFAGSTSFPTDAATDFAKDSYYDYPTDQPLLRVININPGLTYAVGGLRDYTKGGHLYTWVERAIDEAKAKNEWVVLTYHVGYLNAGSDHGADMSTGYYAPTAAQFGDIFTLAGQKKVDLILNGHEHNYQRSKQLQLGDACPAITHDVFDAACVGAADGTAASPYVRGAGPVQLIIGTGGHKPSSVDDADGDRQYMIVADDGADNCGYVSFAVTTSALTGTFENACTGTLSDSFTIAGTSAPTPTATPTASTAPTTAAPTPPAAASSSPLVVPLAIGAGVFLLVAGVGTFLLIRARRAR